MRQVIWGLALFLAVGLPALAFTPAPAAAAPTCACLDTNDDGLCTGVDIVVDSDDWLKGPGVGLGGNFVGSKFLLPAGCSIVVSDAPSGGIVVTADKITIRGSFISTPSGGEGVFFRSLGDILVDQVDPLANRPHVESGGANKLATNVLANAAVAKSSVGLSAGGVCNIGNADLRGNPVTGSGQVGIGCVGEVDIHGSTILAAGIDIQSLSGRIDATATAGVAPLIGIECDDPTKNLAGFGNNNGVLDAGDFPCELRFNNQADIVNVCVPDPNRIQALNNPLVIIAKLDLKLDSAVAPGNLVEGRFLVNLVSEDGNVDTDNATITNASSGTPLGGAKIFVFANPTSVSRVPVLKEKSFGPSTGNIEINGACYVSFNDIFFGSGGTLVGTPAAAPCAQVTDFIPVLDGP